MFTQRILTVPENVVFSGLAVSGIFTERMQMIPEISSGSVSYVHTKNTNGSRKFIFSAAWQCQVCLLKEY
jgi:hypothetical protein